MGISCFDAQMFTQMGPSSGQLRSYTGAAVVSIYLYTPPEGGYSKKFYTGRLRREVQPLTLLYTIFSEKAPLSYGFYWKKAPLSYTFLGRLRNKSFKQEDFLSFLFFT